MESYLRYLMEPSLHMGAWQIALPNRRSYLIHPWLEGDRKTCVRIVQLPKVPSCRLELSALQYEATNRKGMHWYRAKILRRQDSREYLIREHRLPE